MRISSGVVAALLIMLAGAAQAQQPAAYPPVQYASAQAALERGLGSFQSGKHEAAVAALNSAAAMGDPSARFIAEFYLARMYSENASPVTDHTKAFVLYRKIADENLDLDPATSKRAPFVAKALIALAAYVRAGLPEIDLAPNPRRAADYLHHAAVFFGDRDAQFELARTYLGGDASSDEVRRGLHHLSVLTEEGYAPAQALLADLFWHGRQVKKDDRRALALVTIAAENAPAHERIWIEESYAVIFCAASPALRADAGELVGRWRQQFAQLGSPPVSRTGAYALMPERQCASGEKVAFGSNPADAAPAAAAASIAAAPAAQPSSVAVTKGSAVPPVGFRAAGILEASAKK